MDVLIHRVVVRHLLAEAEHRFVLLPPVRLLLHLLTPLHQHIAVLDPSLSNSLLILCRANSLPRNSRRLKANAIPSIIPSIGGNVDDQTIIAVLVPTPLSHLTLARLWSYHLVSILTANAYLSVAKIPLQTRCRTYFLDYWADVVPHNRVVEGKW